MKTILLLSLLMLLATLSYGQTITNINIYNSQVTIVMPSTSTNSVPPPIVVSTNDNNPQPMSFEDYENMQGQMMLDQRRQIAFSAMMINAYPSAMEYGPSPTVYYYSPRYHRYYYNGDRRK
jgi:hypothetical protein